MTRDIPRSLSMTVIALALGASSAMAMTPLDQSGRGPAYTTSAESARTGMGYDKAGGEVRSRSFDDTRALEQSGRGSSMDKSGSSAAQSQGDSTNANSFRSSAYDGASTSESIPDQVAANQSSAPDNRALSSESGLAYGDESSEDRSDQLAAQEADADKLVVIVPPNWEGSVPDLIASLESSTDESAIVVVTPETWHEGPPPATTGAQ